MKMKLPAQETTVEKVFGGMTGTQTREFLRLCAERGYQTEINRLATAFPECPLDVDRWFVKATEGQRTHMANKLIKHGYPEVGVHSKDHIEGEAYNLGIEEGRRICIRELASL